MWETALELASRITNPNTIAVFISVLIAAILVSLKAKNSRLLWSLAAALFALGISPLIASTFLASRGVYRIRIVVLGTDGQPVSDAEISSSTGGEIKKASGNWEFDVSPQTKPSDDKITLFASQKNTYTSGTSTLTLNRDYYVETKIQLAPLAHATIHGVVKNENGLSVFGAQVSVVGYSQIATTDQMGNFSLPTNRADGQFVSLRAEKNKLSAEVSIVAGKDAEIVLRKR